MGTQKGERVKKMFDCCYRQKRDGSGGPVG